MTREIKFRAWDKKKKMFWFWKGFMDIPIPVSTDFGRCEIMQFTGLLDKNMKEIYEGDIVRFYTNKNKEGSIWCGWPHPDAMPPHSWIGIMEFDKGSFTIIQCKYEGLIGEVSEEFPEHEVIGNVYENPELYIEVRK